MLCKTPQFFQCTVTVSSQNPLRQTLDERKKANASEDAIFGAVVAPRCAHENSLRVEELYLFCNPHCKGGGRMRSNWRTVNNYIKKKTGWQATRHRASAHENHKAPENLKIERERKTQSALFILFLFVQASTIVLAWDRTFTSEVQFISPAEIVIACAVANFAINHRAIFARSSPQG